jgi:antitoxin VapB
LILPNPRDIYHQIDTIGYLSMTGTAKLFTHGRSQAVRLPKEFRFAGREVRVSKVGDKVILEPLEQNTDSQSFWAAIDSTGDMPFMPEGREQPPMPDDRKVFDL